MTALFKLSFEKILQRSRQVWRVLHIHIFHPLSMGTLDTNSMTTVVSPTFNPFNADRPKASSDSVE